VTVGADALTVVVSVTGPPTVLRSVCVFVKCVDTDTDTEVAVAVDTWVEVMVKLAVLVTVAVEVRSSMGSGMKRGGA
jgi:hypothetical protein